MNNFLIVPPTIKYFETGRGLAYTADITYKGKKVGIIENQGNGGDTFPRFNDDCFKEFRAEANENCNDSFEPESTYIEQMLNDAEESNKFLNGTKQ